MGSLTDDRIDQMRKEGRSEHEIAYFNADKQRDYKPLLEDPTTPEPIITDIADRLTILSLKILAFKHPNISERSQRYMLDKSDKKDYQKELVEAFLSNEKKIDDNQWSKLRKFYNKAQRFDICVIELLEEQSDIFSTQKLDVIFNTLSFHKPNELEYMKAILDHKNFDVKILEGVFMTTRYSELGDSLETSGDMFSFTEHYKIMNMSKNKADIFLKMFMLTSDEVWLPEEAKDVFLF